MNSRTVNVSALLVARAIINNQPEILISKGDKVFPSLSTSLVKKYIFESKVNLVKLPNRWAFYLPNLDEVKKAARFVRDHLLSNSTRIDVNHVRGGNGRFVNTSEWLGKVNEAMKIIKS